MRRIDPYLFDGIAKKFVLLFALSVVLKLIKVKTMWYDRWMMFECFDLVAWFEANSKWQAPELPLEKANFVECHVVFCPNSKILCPPSVLPHFMQMVECWCYLK
jgi:hypothetical protein